MTPRVLAIETASDACSVAVSLGDGVRSMREVATRAHARRLLPLIDHLLQEAGLRLSDLDAVAFGRGPGSFTGIRLAAAVAQGLAFGGDLPVVPVSTLAALAQEAPAERVAVAVDARMDQVYWGAFIRDDHGIMSAASVEGVLTPADVALPPGHWHGVGSGWVRYQERFTAEIRQRVALPAVITLPDARGVLALALAQWRAGQRWTAEQALPVYLRDDVAKKAADAG